MSRLGRAVGLLDGLVGIVALGPSFDFSSHAMRGNVCVLLYNLLPR